MKHDTKELDKQKSKLLGMVLVGCNRDDAAHAVGWSESQLRTALKADESFALELAKHEGFAELHHMRLVHEAAKDEKNWRASTWWIDRRSKVRKERCNRRVVTTDELTEFVEGLVHIILTEVTIEADRERLASILLSTVNEDDHDNLAELLRQMGLEAPQEPQP